MTYPNLKALAIDTLDDLSDFDLVAGYGTSYTATTLLDNIQITAPVRAVMPPLVNKKFRVAYQHRWRAVSPMDTVPCLTIGDFIKLVSTMASESVPDREPT